MLILTRRVGEHLMIGTDIQIRVLTVKGNQVRLGIEAPRGIEVHRSEVFERIRRLRGDPPDGPDGMHGGGES